MVVEIKTEKLIKLKEFSKNLNILYVDDDPTLQLITLDILSNFFANITIANDGVEGLEKFRNDDFDLIISDIEMPNMNGIKMISEIRKKSKDLVILILSAYIKPEYFVETIKLGIDGYIIKPMEYEQFISLLYKSIEKIRNKKKVEEYKHNLELQVQEQLKEVLEKNKFIQEREKFATMGEMIDTIAHQFKQPLSIIKLRTQIIQQEIKDNILKEDYLQESLESIDNQVEHALSTINEFKDFLRIDIERSTISIKELLQSIITLLNDELIKHKIKLKIIRDTETKIDIIVNEFKHVLLNLITNSKDAFIENKIKNKIITIETKKYNDHIELSILDNAGGIPEEYMEKVFIPNFTTKTPNEGTGIGLYISKIILEKINASIKVQNVNDGAKFTISIPLL